MSETPRTDALDNLLWANYYRDDPTQDSKGYLEMTDYARLLERELHAMTLRCHAADRTANAAAALSVGLCDTHGGRGFRSDCVVCNDRVVCNAAPQGGQPVTKPDSQESPVGGPAVAAPIEVLTTDGCPKHNGIHSWEGRFITVGLGAPLKHVCPICTGKAHATYHRY